MAGLKRKVFYLPGFDPRGARFYYNTYKEQAARYGALSGHAIAVSPRLRSDRPQVRWTVDNPAEGVHTDYAFLNWDDIIRRVWVTNPVSLFTRSARTYWNYARRLDWPRLWAMPHGPLITLFYPPLSTLLFPLLLWLLAFAIGAAFLPAGTAALAALLPALGLGGYLIHRIKSFWLLRFFIFNNDHTHGRSDPEIEIRLRAFAALVAESFEEDWDEILLVAHSNGSILSVPLMAEIARLAGPRMPGRFALVTLGHCLPLFGCHRDAHAFHAQLREVADLDFTWVDIGFPPDGACYSKVFPFAPHARRFRGRLTQLSPQFFRFWPPAQYAERVKNKYQLHFDYLRCGEALSPIDHLSMTAGARPLAGAVQAFQAAA
jgi:hypothetical protein